MLDAGEGTPPLAPGAVAVVRDGAGRPFAGLIPVERLVHALTGRTTGRSAA